MSIIQDIKQVVLRVSDRVTPALQQCNKGITGVYFEHGHIIELNNTLQQKDKSITQRFKKYPCVFLREPIETNKVGDFYEFTLNIAIFASSQKDWKSSDRHENVIQPILNPIYNELIRELRKIGLFQWDGDLTTPPHRYKELPNLGVESRNGNLAYVLNDVTDAVTIENLKLKKSILNCKEKCL